MWTSATSSTRGGRPSQSRMSGEPSSSSSIIKARNNSMPSCSAWRRWLGVASPGNVSSHDVGRNKVAGSISTGRRMYSRIDVMRNDGSSIGGDGDGGMSVPVSSVRGTDQSDQKTTLFMRYSGNGSDAVTMMPFKDYESSMNTDSDRESERNENRRHSLLHLMGLWEMLSSSIQHVPGDPSVVAQAIKVCIGSGAAAHAISKGIRLSVRLAELRSPGKSPRTRGGWSGVSCDVIAAAILSTAFLSAPVFPSSTIRQKIGRRVAQLSEDIVKVSKIPSRIDVYDDDDAAAIREMCLAFYDISATKVSVLSRLIDLETIMGELELLEEGDYGRRALHHCLALEGLQIYAPLGHALGLKSESLQLENLSLEILFPSAYKETSEWLNTYVSRHDTILESARQELETAVLSHPEFLNKAESIIVQSRTKSAISTLKKLLRLGNLSQGGRKRDEVFDVLGLRAIVVPRGDDEASAIEACYIVENVIGKIWPVIQSRSKDYIASPKPNGYSSIHRSVIVADGVRDEVTIVELQIRTAAMHATAEQGDASHGAYKGGLTASQTQHLQNIQEKKLQQIALDSASTDYDAGEGLFRSIDINGDGEVSLSELQSVLEELGEEGAEALLERFDMNNDGVISIEEFMEFQKIMGLSHAISQVDQNYAKSLPSLAESKTILQAYKGENGLQTISNKGEEEDLGLMHVWRSSSWGRTVSEEKCKAKAFTEGDDSLSSSSLDDGMKGSSNMRRPRGEYHSNAHTYRTRGNVITIEDDTEFDASEGITDDQKLYKKDAYHDQEAEESRSTLTGAMHGLKRLFSKAGTEEIEAIWSIEAVLPNDVSNAVGKILPSKKIMLPRHGPVIIGAVRDKDNDYIVDIPTISGRHARLEVIRDRINGMSKCVIMDLGSTNAIWVNRSRIMPFKEVHLFPGDVICLAEPSIAFKVDACNDISTSENLGPAVQDALSIAEILESEAATMGIFAPKIPQGETSLDAYHKLIEDGDFQSAYMLLLGEALRNPKDGVVWAKLSGIERQRARRNIQNSTVSTTRAFIRAAIERFDLVPDLDLRRQSLAKMFTTWALLEFDVRNDVSARILFQKGARCLKKLSDVEMGNKLLAKLLSNWATREWKLKDLLLASRLCLEALEVDPRNPHVLTLAGKINAEAGKYQAARDQFKQAFIANKNFFPALQAWGKMEASLKQIETARNLFQAAYVMDKKNPYILQAWAHAESQAGNAEKARELFQQCVKAHPECRAAWHGWAKLEDDRCSYDKAKHLYLKVLELKPKSKRTLSSLGRLERLLGNLDQSEKLLRRALRYDSNHVSSLQELSNTLKLKKQFTEAHSLQKKVTRINAMYRSQLAGVRRIQGAKGN